MTSAATPDPAPAPAPTLAPTPTGHTAYHLDEEQLGRFDRDGYLVLPGTITGDLLQRLRAAADRWIEHGRTVGDTPEQRDFGFADRPSGRVMFRIDYLHDKGEPASLELLGSPELLGIAESLHGVNFVPTYESMVFKDAGDGAPIAWHQDAVHPRRWRIVNIDVYLDESVAGHGALRVVPGSHRSVTDVCALADGHGWDVPGAVEVPLQAGDVLLHDVMLVHGSPPVEGGRLRRTLYYEFRAAEQVLAEGPWDRAWVERRLRLVPLALAEHARSRPGSPAFDWRPDPALRPRAVGDTEAELRVVHETHTPGSWCSAGDVALT
ncbi:phytanoyl-CoA dioxygenase family protein [Nocardioides rubriscoriae]|uniref:phytanoyl-CoA dioxygenase family protein n=1 Tax=Nocardioides rubriscoriae TaxID=642762 RepID=UPI0011DF7676|nr:phytanoyl-CoA dioxygenase family protein [Nocardioides rubriscoriae]